MSSSQDFNYRLIIAVRERKLEAARELINSFGLSYSKAWSNGYNLLRDAVKKNHTEVAKLLLTSGCKVNSKNSKIKPTDTPLHFAVQNGNVEIVKMLLDKGANIFAKNGGGTTPVYYALENNEIKNKELLTVKKNILKIFELFLENGAYVDYESNSREPRKGYTPLHFAVENGSKEIITLLICRGANVNVKAGNGITPLHIAAKKENMHIAEELLNHGACTNSLTLEKITPLHTASEQGCEETVKLLLNRGADIHASAKDNLTPLHIATKRGHAKIVKLLLQHGAKVDNEDKDGKTVLHFAVENGNLMIVKEVLKYCPDVNNQSNRSSLKTAVYGYGKEKIIQALLEYGLHMNPGDTNNPVLLHVAVQKGYLKILEYLLKNGADVNTSIQNLKYGKGFTPMHTAAKYKQEEIAKLLISYEADINAQNESGKTPIFYAIENADLIMTELLLANNAFVKDIPELLFLAVKKECIKIVEALLQHDVDVNASDAHGRTALYFTSIRSSTESSSNPDIKGKIAELLLSKGANVNAQTKDSQTILNTAIESGYAKVVEALLKYNANLNSAVKSVLPFHLSVQRGNIKIITMLLNKGADVNAKQKDGRTALHIAILKEYQIVTKILLKYGSDINAQDDYGRTALHLAAKVVDVFNVQTLLKYGSDINVLNKDNQTPFNYAIDHNFDDDDCDDDESNNDDFDVNYFKAVDFDVHYLDEVDFDDDDSYDDDSKHDYFDIGPEELKLDCICETLFYHILKMKTANLYLNKENLLSLNVVGDRIYFQVKCENEIAKMKGEKINNANISFYDILSRDTSSLANYMRNENVVQVLKSDDYKSKFPIYASMIKCSFRKAMKRKELLDQVNEIYFLFNNLLELPYDCTDKILSYLSDEDLRIIKDAS